MPLIKAIKNLFSTFKFEELQGLHISDAITRLKKEHPGIHIIIYRENEYVPFGRMHDTLRIFVNSENKVISYHRG